MNKTLVLSAVTAVAGTIIIVGGGLAGTSNVIKQEVREELRIETVISIEDPGLTDLAVGEKNIWALNSTDGIVYEVRTATNEIARVIDVGEDSKGLAIADGRVWTIGREKGYVTTAPLTGGSSDLRRFTVIPDALDVAPARKLHLHGQTSEVWVVAGEERPAIALNAQSVSGYPPVVAGGSLTNFRAVGGNGTTLWGLTLDDRLARLDSEGNVEWDQRIEDEPRASKIVADDSGVWLLDEDRIVRVDIATRRVDELELSARDFALGDGHLWVVDKSTVRIYDSGSAKPIESISIDTEPLQVSFAGHSAWVLGQGGKIFRISRSGQAMQLTQPRQDDRLVYAYSSDGDLWAEQYDGDDVKLVVSEESDRRPSLSPDGQTIAFQRDEADSGTVYFLDLTNGEERFLGHGGWPTYGHRGAFAYVSRGRATYGINIMEGERKTFMATPENPAQLAWDIPDDNLYFVAGPAGARRPYRIRLSSIGIPSAPELLAPLSGPVGANFPVAAPSSGRLYVVRACCAIPGAEIIYEFGYIDLANPQRPFVAQLELTDAGLQEPIALADMHGLQPPALGDPQAWTDTTEDAWLVTDGTTVAFLYRDGTIWGYADQRLEHPGRINFDGFGRAPMAGNQALGTPVPQGPDPWATVQ